MKNRIWLIRVLLSLLLTILSFFVAYLQQGSLLLNYINVTFMIGLGLLLISGIMTVHFSGFFDAFWLGWKRIFSREDPYTDHNHWSYDESEDEEDEEKKQRRKKAKNQLFIFIPLFVSALLIGQSVILLIFL